MGAENMDKEADHLPKYRVEFTNSDSIETPADVASHAIRQLMSFDPLLGMQYQQRLYLALLRSM